MGGDIRSLAIAGGWGYIGQRFLTAALDQGLDVYVFDPSPPPASLDLRRLTRVQDEQAFYSLPVDLFHLAVHPQHRRSALNRLSSRARGGETVWVLCEKPVALPEAPEACDETLCAARETGLMLFYDFPELYDPLTRRIHDYLGSFQTVRIRELWFQRSKDREDPANPRNYKLMVPIQYQESVHCMAFLIDLMERFGDRPGDIWGCVSMRGTAELYDPPNPDAYPHVVDGRCLVEMDVGGVLVHVYTDFKRGASSGKMRRLAGEGDGRPFVIEANYLEGAKYLLVNGEDQGIPADSCSYGAVLQRLRAWQRGLSQRELNDGRYPNARLACSAYVLSALLWEACHTDDVITVGSQGEARSVAEQYRSRMRSLGRYAASASMT